MSISIPQCSQSEFRMELCDWPKSTQDISDWKTEVLRVVRYAFSARPAFLITYKPISTSFGHFLQASEVIQHANATLLINTVPNCTDELLAELCNAEEFERGLLCITSNLSTETLCTAVEMMGEGIAGPTRVTVEALVASDDFRVITWFHPLRKLGPLMSAFELDGV